MSQLFYEYLINVTYVFFSICQNAYTSSDHTTNCSSSSAQLYIHNCDFRQSRPERTYSCKGPFPKFEIYIIFQHPVALWHHFYIVRIPSVMQRSRVA
jgi:hypothetical protein